MTTTTTLPRLPSPANRDIAEKSRETMEWLRNNILVGYVDQRGPAWWAQAVTKDGQWELPKGSHFKGSVPMTRVRALLDIPWIKAERTLVEYFDEKGELTLAEDQNFLPVINARTGEVFSYPREGYKIHPYLQTLKGFIDKILHDDNVGVGSCGLLKKGGVAFLQAVLPQEFEVAGYGYQPYVTAITSVDMSRATTYLTGALGAVCDNTVDAAALAALTKLKVRHTRNSAVSVQAAREKLGIQLLQVAESLGEAIDSLASVSVSKRQFGRWLDLAVPLVKDNGAPKEKNGLTFATRKRDELTRLWTEDPKVAPWSGTAFGVMQLDNTYRTWIQTVRGADGGRLERNYANMALGYTAKEDVKALELLGQVLRRELVAA